MLIVVFLNLFSQKRGCCCYWKTHAEKIGHKNIEFDDFDGVMIDVSVVRAYRSQRARVRLPLSGIAGE